VLFFGGILIIGGVFLIPSLPNLYLDGLIRSAIFVALFGFFVIRLKLSDEVHALYTKWVLKKLLNRPA
jgi:hypothetical protein